MYTKGIKLTVQKFINTHIDDLANDLTITTRNTNQYQIGAWKKSLQVLKNTLNDPNLVNLTIILEYLLPAGHERIDFVILGQEPTGKPLALIGELKGWRKASPGPTNYTVFSDLGKSTHPEYQLLNYVGKLKFSHSASPHFIFIPSLIFYNATSKAINLNFSQLPQNQIFFKNNIGNFTSWLNSLFAGPLTSNLIDAFYFGTYTQNKTLFDAIKTHYNDIVKQSVLTLAQSGWGLSSKQAQIVDEIIQNLKQGQKDIIYLIQGRPGSGKTLVAIHLLLNALANEFKAILGYRNNRLIYSIRNVFDQVQKGISDQIKFYSVGPRAGFRGIAEPNFPHTFDLVIFDEAQRMTTENIKYAMQRGRIVVFFYDENQILNAEEEGWTENFEKEAHNQHKKIIKRTLDSVFRVSSGSVYTQFVETLLNNPNKLQPWRHHSQYPILLTKDIDTFINHLKKQKQNGFNVAIVAAFTESPGDLKNPTSINNLRIGYPLPSGFDLYKNTNVKVYWLMDPKRDYVPFWVDGKSNDLKHCASIYGCQGFETDFVGLVWGRDLVWDKYNRKWIPGPNSEDSIGKPSLKQLIKKARKDEKTLDLVLKLLINRYRIFLTRGIKGTIIFCEDEETADFLGQWMPTI